MVNNMYKQLYYIHM